MYVGVSDTIHANGYQSRYCRKHCGVAGDGVVTEGAGGRVRGAVRGGAVQRARAAGGGGPPAPALRHQRLRGEPVRRRPVLRALHAARGALLLAPHLGLRLPRLQGLLRRRVHGQVRQRLLCRRAQHRQVRLPCYLPL